MADHAPGTTCPKCLEGPLNRATFEECANCGHEWISHYNHVNKRSGSGSPCRVVTPGACCARPCKAKCRSFEASDCERKGRARRRERAAAQGEDLAAARRKGE